MLNLPFIVAFIAGLVSFLSPCVLPIIPGFLAYLGGESSSGAKTTRWSIFVNSVFFVAGFSLVFAALGVLLNGVLAHYAYALQTWLSYIGGTIIIFFGLYLMGFVKIPFLEYDHKFSPKIKVRSRHLTSLLFGFAFAAGWTPCVGPVLGGILGLATSVPAEAFYLLLWYALGLGIPFLLVGLFVDRASGIINKYIYSIKYVVVVFGALLVIIGVFIFTNNLSLLLNFGFVNSLILKLHV